MTKTFQLSVRIEVGLHGNQAFVTIAPEPGAIADFCVGGESDANVTFEVPDVDFTQRRSSRGIVRDLGGPSSMRTRSMSEL